VTSAKHECYKRFCSNYQENKDIGHLCYMRPLKDTLPAASDKVLYVFYDIETMQNTEYEEQSKLHVPNLVCAQQFCSRCEDVEDGDCARCGRRKHTFRQDPVGELLRYLTEPLPWVNKVIVFAHHAKAFDLHFILNRALLLRWKPELIMNGQKIMCMRVEHLVFLDSVSFHPFPLRKLPEALGLTASKSWYPHYFNTEENLYYIGPIPDVSYYGVNEMGEGGGTSFTPGTRARRSLFTTIGRRSNRTVRMT